MSGNVSVYSRVFKYLLKMLTDCKWKISVSFKIMLLFLIILHKTLWINIWVVVFFYILQYVNSMSHFPTYEGEETSLNNNFQSTFGEHKICISKNLVTKRWGCCLSPYSIIKSRHYNGSPSFYIITHNLLFCLVEFQLWNKRFTASPSNGSQR